MPLVVLKSDNRREPFDRNKLRDGLAMACKKRAISAEQIEKIVSDVELFIQEKYVMEVPSNAIGDLVIAKLKTIDPVAYLRFVSVYKQFSEIESYIEEVKDLKKEKKGKKKSGKKEPIPPISLVVTYSKN